MGQRHFYTSKLAKALYDLQCANELCDVTIHMGGRVFHAHKAVLAASNSYFKAMFTSGFRESNQEEVTIDGKPEIFDVILEYAYTGVLTVDARTAYDILEMACYMQFTDATKCLANSIKAGWKDSYRTNLIGLSVADVYKISQVARCHVHLKQLALESEKYLCHHLDKLSTTPAFLEGATLAFFKRFLKRHDLPIEGDETMVLELVINWLNCDWDNRHIHAASLLSLIRLGLVPEPDMKELISDDMHRIPAVQQLLQVLQQEKQTTKSRADLAIEFPLHFTPRSSITAPVMFGKVSQSKNRSIMTTKERWIIHYFNVATKQWQPLHRFVSLQDPPVASLIVANGVLYVSGCLIRDLQEHAFRRQVESLCCFKYYNASKNKWEGLPGMITSRQSLTYPMLHVDGFIYVFGGYGDCRDPMPSFGHMGMLGRYGNKWEGLPGMITSRQSLTYPMLHVDGYIYVFGGYGDCRDPMPSFGHMGMLGDVERFDIMWNRWEAVPSLPEGFHWVSAITFSKKIVVYGVSDKVVKRERDATSVRAPSSKEQCGNNQVDRKHVLMVFNPNTDIWYTKIEEQHGACTLNFDPSKQRAPDAIVFIYKDQCFRVLYQAPKTEKVKCSFREGFLMPLSVTRLKFKNEGDDVKVSLGESFNQHLIPPNNLGAFCIKDEVFINVKGAICKTELRIGAKQTHGEDLSAWQGFKPPAGDRHSNIVCLTFDKKKLGYYR